MALIVEVSWLEDDDLPEDLCSWFFSSSDILERSKGLLVPCSKFEFVNQSINQLIKLITKVAGFS